MPKYTAAMKELGSVEGHLPLPATASTQVCLDVLRRFPGGVSLMATKSGQLVFTFRDSAAQSSANTKHAIATMLSDDALRRKLHEREDPALVAVIDTYIARAIGD